MAQKKPVPPAGPPCPPAEPPPDDPARRHGASPDANDRDAALQRLKALEQMKRMKQADDHDD